jgi:plastocyanin
MKTIQRAFATAVVLFTLAGSAWAETTITTTREESRPAKAEAAVGEDISWINQTGGTAHVWFGGREGVRFYVGRGARVRFDAPGTYEYTVHVSGTKAHAHTGTIVVK